MKIVYWSGTGNTESIANLIAEGIKANGKDAELINVSDVRIDELLAQEVLILGCPAMGDEVLEECEFEPFIEEILPKVNGKKVFLFGSYGWGDGEWMRNWQERMEQAGCQVLEEPLIIQSEPDGNEEECKEFGKKVALA